MKILAIGGSIRSNPKSTQMLMDLVNTSSDLKDYQARAKDLVNREHEGKKRKIFLTNTEVCAGAALLAARLRGAEVDYFTLTRLFSRREKPLVDYDSDQLGLHDEMFHYDYLNIDEKVKTELIAMVKQADGILMASPVYFGDRSSVSNKFMQIVMQENLLVGKTIAGVTAGAKRNGGQETANIFYLNEGRQLGGYIVGNGPKSSQYGGTAVAGDIGSIVEDDWGLETCFGTGNRISQFAQTMSAKNPKVLERKLKVLILITMDVPERTLAQTLWEYAAQVNVPENIEYEVIELLDGQIERCLACNICPIPESMVTPESYACIIKTKRDTMKPLREKLLEADGMILAGLNFNDMSEVMFRYQAFTERTRFIRRNDFEMTNTPVTSFLLEEVGASANNIFELKVMCSYMRHNTVVCPPIKETRHNGNVLLSGKAAFAEFATRVDSVSRCRAVSKGYEVSYKAGGAGGYADNRLDVTSAKRK